MTRSVVRDRTLALLLGSLTAFAPLSSDMYLPSLPAIQKDLGTSANNVQLTLAAFFAGLAFGQLLNGPLSDRFGRKRPLVAGLALYAVASLACALAPTIQPLIALVATLGFVGPNATAVAMERHGRRAGKASATLGAGQYVIAALASAAVGLANDGTMRPMAIVMASCAACAAVAAAFGRRAPPDAMLIGDGEAPAHRAT